MKKLLQFILIFTITVGASGCSKDDDGPDDDVIWDIAPAGVVIQLVDEEGNDLLQPTVSGNWVGEPMTIGYDDKVYDVIWVRDDLQPKTRFYMPYFYGAVWTGLFNYEKLSYCIYFGELFGDRDYDMKLTLGITAINTVYDFEFSHKLVWKKKEPHFDDHITYSGQRIDGNVLKLVVPKNPNSDKAN